MLIPAVLVLAAWPGFQDARQTRSNSARPAETRPSIVQSPIPFPPRRKRETRRYARRHYGLDGYRLVGPKAIVEHYTGSNSYRSAYETFARDVPDIELHELPGLCTHFIVKRNGVIHQLVPLRLMCRHTVGLNWTAIGIEHVGTSDQQVLGNRRQREASLRLTRWLQSRFRIRTRNVIGHAESLRSPFHRERVASLRRQTHSDFDRRSMGTYRRLLDERRAGSRPTRPARRAARRTMFLGRSVRGRPIRAVGLGDRLAARKVLVVGAIHGDETAGIAIARRLRRRPPPGRADLWVVRSLNPDGLAAGTRQNARGVDLNRNFPHGWRPLGRRGDATYSGPRPLSEPETRLARALVRRLRPRITVWFHQPLALVDRSGGDAAIERRFARHVGLPLRRLPPYPGTATRWQNSRFPRTTAFVVELPPGPLGAPRVRRYAAAVGELVR
jgi:hypothetical protein